MTLIIFWFIWTPITGNLRFQVKVTLSWWFHLVLFYFLHLSKSLYLNLNWCHIFSFVRSRLSFKCSMGLSQMNNCLSAYGSLGTTNQLSGRCFIGHYSNLCFARFLMNRTAWDKELSSRSSKVVRLVVAKACKANWADKKKG